MLPQATLRVMMAIVVALTISGLSVLSLASDARNGAAVPDGYKGEPDRPVSDSLKLRANVINYVRYVVTGVCERQGVRQIADILKHSPLEEMWGFLPRASGSEKCQWHELGRDEESGADSAHFRVDRAYLEQLMAANSEIHLYHFHPLKYFQCASDAGCRETAVGVQTGTFDPRWISDVVFSMPSASDVHFMMEITSRFQQLHQALGTIKHKVVTPYGIVDYALTEKGLEKYEVERFGRSEGLYIPWVTASRLADERVEKIVRENPGGLVEAVGNLAQTLNSEYLRVSYSPFASE